MAMHMQFPKQTNWWLWVGGALAVLILIVAALYGFDLFGTDTVDTTVDPVAPAAVQSE